MHNRFWRITAFIFFLGLAQAALASFCPIGSSKKAPRPPMQRPVAPVMAWVPAQTMPRQVINGQPMMLVPVYPVNYAPMMRPPYTGYRR